MKLMKATQFRIRYFEKGSEPDMKTLKKLIAEGDLPGKRWERFTTSILIESKFPATRL